MAYSVGSFLNGLKNEDEINFYQKIIKVIYEYQSEDIDDIKILKKIIKELEEVGFKL